MIGIIVEVCETHFSLIKSRLVSADFVMIDHTDTKEILHATTLECCLNICVNFAVLLQQDETLNCNSWEEFDQIVNKDNTCPICYKSANCDCSTPDCGVRWIDYAIDSVRNKWASRAN